MDELNEIISRFVDWRIKSGLTIRDGATILGISPGYLAKCENQRRTPSYRVASKMRRIIGKQKRKQIDKR